MNTKVQVNAAEPLDHLSGGGEECLSSPRDNMVVPTFSPAGSFAYHARPWEFCQRLQGNTLKRIHANWWKDILLNARYDVALAHY
jgi:hypothetical protein